MASQSRAGQPVLNGLEFGLNEWVVDEQYEQYLRDPGSVDQAWRDLFASPGPAADRGARDDTTTVSDSVEEAAIKAVRVAALIHAYRVRGHLMADTDPLTKEQGGAHPELDIKAFGLGEEDLARTFVVDDFAGQAAMTLGAVRRVTVSSPGSVRTATSPLTRRRSHGDGRRPSSDHTCIRYQVTGLLEPPVRTQLRASVPRPTVSGTP
ncbi:2-oxoglutarate dehydrogenase E1 subunit family protein [Streptomyces sp. NPDC001156]